MYQAGAADPRKVRINDLSKKKHLRQHMRVLQRDYRYGYKQLSNGLKALEDENTDQRSISQKEYSRTAASTSHVEHHEKIPKKPSSLLSLSRLRCRSLQLPKGYSMTKKLQMRIAALEASSQRKQESYATVAGRKLHMENYDSSKWKRRCPLCFETFTTSESFLQHLKVHQNTLSASICDMDDFLSRKRARAKYLAEMHNRFGKSMESSMLESSSSPWSNHKKSPDTHDCNNNTPPGILLDCEYCGAKFREVPDLQRHFETQHRSIDATKSCNYCKPCQKVYSSETEFLDHLSIIHNISTFSVRYGEEMQLQNENTRTDELIIDTPVINNLNTPHHHLQSVCSSLSRLHLHP